MKRDITRPIIITFGQKSNAQNVYNAMQDEYSLWLYDYKGTYYVTTSKAENKDFILLETNTNPVAL